MIRPVIVLAMLTVGLVGAACEEGGEIATVSTDLVEMDADFIVFGGEQYITQNGTVEAHVVYDTAFQWNDSTSVSLRQLELTVFQEDETERARVTSERGLLDQRTNLMVARGNVVLVVPGQERTLRTEELHYDPEAGRIWSDTDWVMEVGDNPPFRGSSFTSDVEFRNFQARGGR